MSLELVNEYQNMSLGLSRITSILEALQNPQNKYRSIHIAGTNGKGSVARYLHFLLSKQGLKVGLFTSPHLVSVNERFQVGSELISDFDYKRIETLILSTSQNSGSQNQNLTLFEQYTALAFQYFAEQKVDIAVIEVGLGGRLDSTNVITPEVCVITNIAYDHQDVLGNNLLDIAREKLGILKSGVPLIIGNPDDKELRALILAEAQNKQCRLTWVNPKNNQAIALSAINQLPAISYPASGVTSPLSANNTDWSEFNNPGRQQIVSKNPLIIIDGAHNPAAAKYLVDYLAENFAGEKFCFVVAVLRRKDARGILEQLSKVASRFVFVNIAGQDCYQATELGHLLPANSKWDRADNAYEAIENIKKEKNCTNLKICITGSLYLLGEYLGFTKN